LIRENPLASAAKIQFIKVIFCSARIAAKLSDYDPLTGARKVAVWKVVNALYEFSSLV
jgi:hypothetical protein